MFEDFLEAVIKRKVDQRLDTFNASIQREIEGILSQLTLEASEAFFAGNLPSQKNITKEIHKNNGATMTAEEGSGNQQQETKHALIEQKHKNKFKAIKTGSGESANATGTAETHLGNFRHIWQKAMFWRL